MLKTVFEKADQAFSPPEAAAIGEQKELEEKNPGGRNLSRGEFGKLALALLRGYSIFDMLRNAGVIDKYLPSQGEQKESYDYLFNWDLEWGKRVGKSFVDMLKKINEKKEWKLESGEVIHPEDIFQSWLFKHGLELLIRNGETEGLALDVMDRYMAGGLMPGTKTKYSLDDSSFATRISSAIQDPSKRMQADIFGMALRSQQDPHKPIFHRDNSHWKDLLRVCEVGALSVRDGRVRIEGVLDRVQGILSENGTINFPFWTGLKQSPLENDLAYVLGREKAEWTIQGNGREYGNRPLVRELELDGGNLSIVLDPRWIKNIQVNSEFSADAFPFEGLPFRYRDLAQMMHAVMRPILGQIEHLLEEPNMFTEVDGKLTSKKVREFYREMLVKGYLQISEFDHIESREDGGWEPDLEIVNLTPRFMEILEVTNLASPVEIIGQFVPLYSEYASEGIAEERDAQTTYQLNYPYYKAYPGDLQGLERQSI